MEMQKPFQDYFIESKGKPIVYNGKILWMRDRIEIKENQLLRVEFLETNSDWKQGIRLNTKGEFCFDDGDILSDKLIFWEDTAPWDFVIRIESKNCELTAYNAWDVGNGTTHACHNGAAMQIEVEGNQRTYYCNDGYPDDDFNDLIFRLTLLEE